MTRTSDRTDPFLQLLRTVLPERVRPPRLSGSAAQRLSGSAAQRLSDSVAQWLSGSMGVRGATPGQRTTGRPRVTGRRGDALSSTIRTLTLAGGQSGESAGVAVSVRSPSGSPPSTITEPLIRPEPSAVTETGDRDSQPTNTTLPATNPSPVNATGRPRGPTDSARSTTEPHGGTVDEGTVVVNCTGAPVVGAVPTPIRSAAVPISLSEPLTVMLPAYGPGRRGGPRDRHHARPLHRNHRTHTVRAGRRRERGGARIHQ